MGIFSSHKSGHSASREEGDNCRVLVLARSATPASEHGEGSLEPEIIWSLAVERPGNTRRRSQQSLRLKKRRSIFGLKRADRKSSYASDHTDDELVQSQSLDVDEYSLDQGNLHISRGLRHGSIKPAAEQPTLLVKLRLKHHVQYLTGTQTLSTKVEQVLYSMTSANCHLPDTATETWIRYALISLQHANILPNNHVLDVNGLINYVQNRTTEFEAEVLSSSREHLECSEVVKEIDYQLHLEENARLKAIFGHNLPIEAFGSEDGSRQSSVHDLAPGIRGGLGGFWISRPQSSNPHLDDDGPYGGLM